jgi:hypothetical protein
MTDAYRTGWDEIFGKIDHPTREIQDHRVVSDYARAAKIPPAYRCGRCEGTGNEMFFMYHACQACGGSGVR